MNKVLLLSISLLALCSSCSKENDTVDERDAGVNKEQMLTENSIVDLAIASKQLSETYKSINGVEQPVTEVIGQVENMATSWNFLNQFSLNTVGFSRTNEGTVNRIISLDESLLLERDYSVPFRNQISDIFSTYGGDLNVFTDVVNTNDGLSVAEKSLLIDAINYSLLSSDHGVDDEWRKRKIMGYIITQEISDLNVVTATTVLNIAMEQ